MTNFIIISTTNDLEGKLQKRRRISIVTQVKTYIKLTACTCLAINLISMEKNTSSGLETAMNTKNAPCLCVESLDSL